MEYFPAWLRITHYVNFVFLTLLIRSGIQILSDHPKLYSNDHCTPGTEWLKFSNKKLPKEGYWTSMDEAVDVSPWIALPGGRHNLGMGRHWHLFSVVFWILNGLVYVVLLFVTGYWQRLIPTSWGVFSQAGQTLLDYFRLQAPSPANFHPYDSLQQLSYAFVVFILGPLAILTGAAMSPAIAGRFQWYTKIFGGRQNARSLHFLILAAYVVFIIIHVTMVVWIDFPGNMDRIVLGGQSGHSGLAIFIGLSAIAITFLIHFVLTRWSQKEPRQVQLLTGAVIRASVMDVLLPLESHQQYSSADISPYFWVNGQLPDTDEWKQLRKDNFKNWTLEVSGLVSNPVHLSLAQLRAMPNISQITKHVCIQGWSGIAQWRGVALAEILKLVCPNPQARYMIFYSFQKDEQGKVYYGSLDLKEACYPQTILAYEMNGKPLPVEHGAPLRLRVETKLGFKMTKWIKSIEIVDDFSKIGEGQGGYREDDQYFGTQAEI